MAIDISSGNSTHAAPDPLVATVVLNWNAGRDTLDCLDSVRALSYSRSFTIAVDNGSDDDSVPLMRAWAKDHEVHPYREVEYGAPGTSAGAEVKEAMPAGESAGMVLIASQQNLGRTGGLNLGIDYAMRAEPPCQYVFVVDNDAVAEQDCLTALVQFDQRMNTGIVGGLVLDYETGDVQFSGRRTLLQAFFSPPLRTELPVPAQAEYWPTANISGPVMLFRRDVLEALFRSQGCYFDVGIFMDGEELAICLAAQRLGFPSLITKRAVVRHKGQRRYRSQYNPMRHYYITRNRTILAGRLLPFHWQMLFHLANVPLSLARAAKALVRRDRRGAHAVMCGLRDGYQGIGGRWKQHPTHAGSAPHPKGE